MSDARIAPGTRADVGLVHWLIARVAGRVQATDGPPNLFLTLGRHRKLALGWLHFAGRLMPGGTLPARETELVILRVAHLAGCTYEYEHHVRRAKKAGVTDADIQRVVAGPSVDGWLLRERTILAAVDALHDKRDLTDEEWHALRHHLDEKRAIELLLLVGHYEMLATTINTLRIQPDAHR
ncbi:MAG TPA: carboxymuconolactone decarboxylase family protein [Acidimicrobiales bacterium]|nr:carboxymuconolactone decarboxylase family protein [Acidimicrobiales bacterium]